MEAVGLCALIMSYNCQSYKVPSHVRLQRRAPRGELANLADSHPGRGLMILRLCPGLWDFISGSPHSSLSPDGTGLPSWGPGRACTSNLRTLGLAQLLNPPGLLSPIPFDSRQVHKLLGTPPST